MKRPPKRYWSPKKGAGETARWLADHVGHQGDACLIWPFGRNPETGYGQLGYKGKSFYAHRFMCELVHGQPQPKQYAVHSCGNGHEGCVNPRHLAWDSSAGNASDRVFHGRGTAPGASKAKLTQDLADQIRALKGHVSQYVIARDYGVSRENIARIHRGVAWTGKPVIRRAKLSPEQRAHIAVRARQMHKEGKTYDEIASTFDISRVYASGLARGIMH